ncbi:hypothetical protein ACI3KW_10845 [Devosia sp. ZW T5_3]|uniref:PBECR3 domain-containing polyvalent protein n=1 Tax=Devosia sp. ZW T5_3 TaxID=3378085 RepID=UPI003853CF9F
MLSQPVKLQPLFLGELPTIQLKQFGLMLPDGQVLMSIPAQKHAIKSHPAEFDLCHPYLSEVVETPSLVGQSPHHVNSGFELVKEIDDQGLIILVAVCIKPTSSGIYMATSTYPISGVTMNNRVKKGHLIFV